jgi:hypothetical protein
MHHLRSQRKKCFPQADIQSPQRDRMPPVHSSETKRISVQSQLEKVCIFGKNTSFFVLKSGLTRKKPALRLTDHYQILPVLYFKSSKTQLDLVLTIFPKIFGARMVFWLHTWLPNLLLCPSSPAQSCDQEI